MVAIVVSSLKDIKDASTRMVFGPGNLFSSRPAACSKAFLLACPSVLALLPLSPNRVLFSSVNLVVSLNPVPGVSTYSASIVTAPQYGTERKRVSRKKRAPRENSPTPSLLNDGQHQIRPLIRPRFFSASKGVRILSPKRNHFPKTEHLSNYPEAVTAKRRIP